uniref:Integrase catalytic domain-containing protein n=1 Tax=Tanacetum cinerariifolium TaxID=118510 RepID=A0A6L2MX61_TANCI|nr:hypothetical protein [Tanacetum cinerariifolium]
MSYLFDFKEINLGYVAFCGNPKGAKISRKGKIRTRKLDFDDVCFVKELKFNLFSVSQMCDKKNNVLFTYTECIVLSLEFKLLDENQVLLRVPRENNMYNVDLKNIVPSGDLTCLFVKATLDDSNFWHRRLGHINFKIMNKLVRGIENQLSFKVKIIRSDNGTEFKNTDLNQFCGMKGIKKEFSVPRTPQQNGIAKRKNKTLIEAAKTMLVDLLLPIPFWAEAVNTACYVQNRVLVTKPQNKTPYELLLGRTPSTGFMGPFGCPVTILNTLDPLGKFNGKVDEGLLVGYSNTDEDTNFEVKEPEFKGRKPQSEVYVSPSSSAQTKKYDDKTKREAKGKSPVESSTGYRNLSAEFKDISDNSINEVNAVDSLVLDVGKILTNSTNTFRVAELEDITYSDDEEDVGAEADFTNLETTITVSPIPTTRVHKDHPVTQIIGDLSSATQTRSMTRVAKDQGGLFQINNDDFHTCMFACFLSQEEPKRVHQALKDPSWIEAMQEELLQFKMQKVWVLVDLPNGKRAIVARIEAIRLFLAYASFMGFMVYQMDVKSAFLYETIKEEVYVYQPLGFEDLDYPDKRGKIDQTLFIKREQCDILLVQIYVDDIIFGSTNKDLCKDFEKLMKDKFQMSLMGELTFFLDGKSASTPIDTEKPLLKDPDGEDVDVHTYRSMIGSLMYLTSSRPEIMFVVCACAHFKLHPKLHTYMQSRGYLDISKASHTWACDASEGFNQIIDFLNASSIKYALTVNPNIYVSCIKQFWSSVSVKKVNDVTRLQALVDKKKVFIIEATIREALRYAESIDRLPNEEIFTELSRMGYEKPSTKLTLIKAFFSLQWKFFIHTILQCMSAKRTSWNEFSSSMASAVIYLSTGRKFNFSKYIFDSLVRNVDSSTKFYMYPRFLQLMIRAQVGNLSSHSTKYLSPGLTQKVFANIRRVGKGFFEVDTPLFEGMIVAQQDDDVADEGAASVVVDDVPAAVDEPSIPSPTPLTQPPPPSQDLPSTSQDAEMSMDLLNTLLETCTTLIRRVEHLEQDKIAQALEITKLKQRVKKLERRNKLRVSKLGRLNKVRTSQRVDTSEDTIMDDVSKQGRIIANMDADEDVTLKNVADIAKEVVVDAEIKESADVQGRQAEPTKLKEVVEVVTTAKLMTEVVTAASATITAADTLIPVVAITTAPSAARRRSRVVIRDPKETATPSTIIHTEPKSKDKRKRIMVHEPKPLKKKTQIEQDEAYARELEAELNKNIDWDEVIKQVQRKEKEDNVVMRYQVLKRKPQTKAQARKNLMIYLRNMAGFKMDYFKEMTYDDIRPIFEKKFNFNVAFLEKTKEQMEEEDSRALKRKVESSEDKAAKKQKLNEEVEELKKHLQIISNDDDVYTEATPLALKVLVVDYEIYTENNKPYHKIKRANGTHKLYLSFLSMLRNFDREDLEVLWKLVKERFAFSKPKNFSDDFLLTTLGAMFEKPDVQAKIWRNQRSVHGLAKVKS